MVVVCLRAAHIGLLDMDSSTFVVEMSWGWLRQGIMPYTVMQLMDDSHQLKTTLQRMTTYIAQP